MALPVRWSGGNFRDAAETRSAEGRARTRRLGARTHTAIKTQSCRDEEWMAVQIFLLLVYEFATRAS